MYKPMTKRQKELLTIFYHLRKEMKKNKLEFCEFDDEIKVKRYITPTSSMIEDILDYSKF